MFKPLNGWASPNSSRQAMCPEKILSMRKLGSASLREANLRMFQRDEGVTCHTSHSGAEGLDCLIEHDSLGYFDFDVQTLERLGKPQFLVITTHVGESVNLVVNWQKKLAEAV